MISAALASAILGSGTAAAPKWTLAVGGDIMLYRISPKLDWPGAVADTFRRADVAYANLEIPLTTSTRATPYKSAADVRAKNQFILKADPGHITHLKSMGFDLLSLANNHGMDYGWEGLKETMDLLDKAGIKHSGGGANRAASEEAAVFRTKSGFRVGMISALAFVGSAGLNACGPAKDNAPGIAVFRFEGSLGPKAKAEIQRRISNAKRKCDFLIVAPHWGIEKQSKPRDWQFQLGRALIDAGADAVFGAHPHVLQGKELYKGKPILYSTGNFISPRPAASAVYTLTFEGTKFKGWEFRPMANRGSRMVWYSAGQEASERRRIEGLDRLIPKPRG